MNLIAATALTMSSRDIADLVGSRHDKVKQSIERLVERRVIVQPPMGDEQTADSLGRPRTESVYHVNKRDSFVVVAQLSPEFTAALVDRWQELEAKLAGRPIVPQSLPEALRLAADLAEEKAVLALENQQQAKKIEALENLFMPGETVPQFAKRLNGVNSQLMLAFLAELKWIYNAETDPDHSPKYRVYAMARDKHLLTEKPYKVSSEGMTGFIRYAPVMLEKGAQRLHDLYMEGRLPMKKTWDGKFFYTKFNPENSL
ncbi:Rha family transcriptional regulator [Pseudomonas plecoglossicida]|uniref:Rha family transcriptional regulator n=1 Tax=Pseudomonas putida group TaxID=136845 RepID=UPI00240EBDDF|nr:MULTISPECIES: Rha family transcriptional regulator [Pseudomonas putida group]MDQ7965638.1 Rha family transcriptional regulator [Pseudomonas plecoglossicida]WFG04474.1 Rha family transcriptional regulator [Pseudomonas putida]